MAVSQKLREPARELTYRPLLVVIALSILLRLATMILYTPGIVFSVDSTRFARVIPNQTGLFDDYWMPAVYPAFLRVVRTIADPLWITIGIQHALGIVLMLVVFIALRRATVSPLAATVAVATLGLAGDVLLIEHALLADSMMLFFAGLACCATIAGLVPRVDARWLVVAGALAGLTAMTRSVGLIVIVLIAVVALCFGGSGWRGRLLPAAGALAGGLIIVVLYLGVFHAAGGGYSGIADMTGWNTYARVAQFADCKKFDPPHGTAQFCDKRPPDSRPGPAAYVWFRGDAKPATSGPPGRFARAAIKAQPLDYAGAVTSDLARYVVPGIGVSRNLGGTDRSFVRFDNQIILENGRLIPVQKSIAVAELNEYYSGATPHLRDHRLLAHYQQWTRTDRWMPLLLLLVIAGAIVAVREKRIAIVAFAAVSAGLFVLPTLTFSYDVRYGVPPTALMTIAAVIGAAALTERWRERSAPD